MKFLKEYPIPIAGLILSLFTLGNLLQSYSQTLRLIIGVIGFIFYVIYVAKLLFENKTLKEEFKNPVIASVFLTFTMATMLLAVYVKPFSSTVSYVVWYIGVVGHGFLILWFSAEFLLKFSIKKVFPSWYIVYVGIAVASVTAPAVQQLQAGKICFWIAFVGYFCILPLVCCRVWKIKEIPEAAQPTLIILSAPASLLLAGYMNSFEQKNTIIVYLLLFFSVTFYVIALYHLPKLLKLKFTPGYSAFTFPLVISALATKLTGGYFKQKGIDFTILIKIEELIAFLIVGWVLVCYLVFLFKPDKKPEN
ncbi:TDT family transporter [Treponema pedis]|uniref:C4-dicarboxylate transporter/malic acid transport protein n=1 Tax=Treponema pedis str. T A4 TaxID=1291379 RepID=S5ZZ19_9SPIR|nr:TDT family transporter [Treponema pedis]AGT43423.1 hypothetical protein TPE_0927 [Treponema pedis str. T A4]QSI04235.1 C4-dicarboxylate ABC transporter [Treponema pedis]